MLDCITWFMINQSTQRPSTNSPSYLCHSLDLHILSFPPHPLILELQYKCLNWPVTAGHWKWFSGPHLACGLYIWHPGIHHLARYNDDDHQWLPPSLSVSPHIITSENLVCSCIIWLATSSKLLRDSTVLLIFSSMDVSFKFTCSAVWKSAPG